MDEFFDIEKKYEIMRERFALRYNGERPTHAGCLIMGREGEAEIRQHRISLLSDEDFLRLTRPDSGEDFQVIDILDLGASGTGDFMGRKEFDDIRRIPLLQYRYQNFRSREGTLKDMEEYVRSKKGGGKYPVGKGESTPVYNEDPGYRSHDIIAPSLPGEGEKDVYTLDCYYKNYFTVCPIEKETYWSHCLAHLASNEKGWLTEKDYRGRTYLSDDTLPRTMLRYVESEGKDVGPAVARWLQRFKPEEEEENKLLAARIWLAEREMVPAESFTLFFGTSTKEAAHDFLSELFRNELTREYCLGSVQHNNVRIGVLAEDGQAVRNIREVMRLVRETGPVWIAFEPYGDWEELDRCRVETIDGQVMDGIVNDSWTPAREMMYAYQEASQGVYSGLRRPSAKKPGETGCGIDILSWDRLRFKEGEDFLRWACNKEHRPHRMDVQVFHDKEGNAWLSCKADGERYPAFRLTDSERERYEALRKVMCKSEEGFLAEHLLRTHLGIDLGDSLQNKRQTMKR
jgi:hypothetical protein